ncbi:hypothetical protein ALI144C_19715 [Actinosynnema sp. ALI-1.44]|uniref:hypothetical protein n=1 Tax=Actinosynnema sp. ALI-1.44 TaxID=1933779 RepID=UPI00097CABB3|nr:hypothetical protein [Actinosynnema sp. ALI-1.44]ONI81544.1 hypothetical protein ALI144C_19715 [Actinosynnema sp. ALI-1.44]
MDRTSAVSALSAVVALTSALVTVTLGAFFEYRRQRATRRHERRALLARYRDPLLETTSALQVRLTELMNHGQRTIDKDTHAYRYLRYNTIYRLAEYLGCVEIIRREVVYLDTGSRRRDKRLLDHLASIHEALNENHAEDSLFRLYGGEQRAIGELMIEPEPDPHGRHRCIGYAAFHRKIAEDPEFTGWFQPLLDDFDRAADDATAGRARMSRLRLALVDLLRFLDPRHRRLLFERR